MLPTMERAGGTKTSKRQADTSLVIVRCVACGHQLSRQGNGTPWSTGGGSRSLGLIDRVDCRRAVSDKQSEPRQSNAWRREHKHRQICWAGATGPPTDAVELRETGGDGSHKPGTDRSGRIPLIGSLQLPTWSITTRA